MESIKEDKAKEVCDQLIDAVNETDLKSAKFLTNFIMRTVNKGDVDMREKIEKDCFWIINSSSAVCIKAGFEAGKQEERKTIIADLEVIYKDYERYGDEQHMAAIEYIIGRLKLEI